MQKEIPKACVSYSHDSEAHKKWVLELSIKLVKNGVDISLDEWEALPGSDLLKFMESCIRDSIITLIICTPNYAEKANKGKGGVGYETAIITGEIYNQIGPPSKFVPILRKGNPKNALPSYLKSRRYIDFRNDAEFGEKFEELLRHIHQQPKYVKPPIGRKPLFEPFAIKSKQIQELDVQFNIPELLKMSISKAIEILGTPKSIFVPSDLQQKLYSEILSTAEYQSGNTSIQIDYTRDREIKKIFISDKTPGMTKEEILKLGNLNQYSNEYKIRIQNWLNPELAKKNKEAEIAGIEVKPILKNQKREKVLKITQRKKFDNLINTITSSPHWHVTIHPDIIIPERIGTLRELWDLMENCRVILRGWDYPHVDRYEKNRAYGIDWIASWCEFFMGHQEYWRLSQSALFEHYFSFCEDGDFQQAEKRAKLNIPLMLDNFKPSGFLSILSTLYSFTEIFEFASRLANKGIFDKSVFISIKMEGIQNRVLFFWDQTRILNNCYYSELNILERKKVYETHELIERSSKLALNTILWFFERFQWLDPPTKLLADEQQKFLDRKIL